jgi:hypothetical protein
VRIQTGTQAPEAVPASIHPNRLRAMFALSIILAGVLGFALLVAPGPVQSAFGMPTEEPYVAGVAYSAWFAFGLVSVLGLRSPAKFWPILLLQLTYKVTWFVAVVFPHLSGGLPTFAETNSAIFAIFVIGDIIVIPWRRVFTK